MNPKVRLVVQFMKSNLHRELTIDEIREVVGLSHSRLHNLVKAELSMSPMHYHKMLRLQRARELLQNPYWKVERVRIEVGYQDHSHFFRDFKAHFGVTPSQYRARHINAKLDVKAPTDEKIVESATKE